VREQAPRRWGLTLQETEASGGKAASRLCCAPQSEGAVRCVLGTRTRVSGGADRRREAHRCLELLDLRGLWALLPRRSGCLGQWSGSLVLPGNAGGLLQDTL